LIDTTQNLLQGLNNWSSSATWIPSSFFTVGFGHGGFRHCNVPRQSRTAPPRCTRILSKLCLKCLPDVLSIGSLILEKSERTG
jgi:hypothetical protein